MFGALKEKLKSWVRRSEKVGEVIEETTKEKSKEKVRKEKPKEGRKEKPSKKEKEVKKVIIEAPEDEVIKEVAKEKKLHFPSFTRTLSEEKFEEMFEELKLILLQNNVAYEAVELIRKSLKENLVNQNLREINLSEELKKAISEILINPPDFIKTIKEELKEKSPFVILFAGINGSGKTTTIAKVAKYLQKNKLSVCLSAADTFRAASIEQIQQHADKLEMKLIKKEYGSDPASVGFEAIQYAKKRKIDVVLIDTAGRMQNKDSLMKEMIKISRVTEPDMRIFIGESITGNDATEQAKSFNEIIDITGIILSKADVDEKGGTAISVSHVTGKPILFLGTGQEYKDLEIFNKEKLIEKLGL